MSLRFRLRSTPLALAGSLLTGVAVSTAQAQSSVQLYGLIDASAGQFQVAGGDRFRRLDSGNMSTSYWGAKGSEDLGGGLRANFALESFLLVDSGNASRVPGVDVYWARNAWVGLSGGFGSLRLGRTGTPLFVSTLLFNAFGDSFGYSPAIRQYFNAPYGTPVVGDTGWNNALAYTTPSLGGLTANVLFSLGEKAATSRGNNIGANVLYFSGPFAFTAAWQSVKSQGVLGRAISAFPGFQEQTAYQVGLSYDLKAVKLQAQAGRIKTDATAEVTTTNLHLSASVPIGTGALLATIGRGKTETAGAAARPESTMVSLGYDHRLSKRTDIYAVYVNDRYTALKNGNTLAFGIRHTF
ncbi:porin [Pseudorhodoferax sp.]|uniref:porin n=1 Tax=Pseudorhodoferax sp. TaxID=1993553 RepID=UPI002DD69069|nr:porin [Pseudorhodoferax sp.]